jgi:hypothetical protein
MVVIGDASDDRLSIRSVSRTKKSNVIVTATQPVAESCQ